MEEFRIDAGSMKKVISRCLQINRECVMSISNNYWETIVTDPANVSMLSVNISKTEFDIYPNDFGELDKYKVGFDLYKMNDVLKSYDNDINLTIEFDNWERMIISDGIIKYNILLLDNEYIKQSSSLPVLDYQCEIVMDGKDFSRACVACKKIDKYIHIGISVSTEELYFTSSNNSDNIEVRIMKDELIDMKYPVENIDSVFNYEYLEKINKSIGKNNTIHIFLGNNYPLKLVFSEYDTEYEFLLAPRLEHED